MQVRFANNKGGVVLTCTRPDGSTTYAKPAQGAYFAAHDLLHFAVESTLKLNSSFFGLIAKGWSIPSFTEPGAAARTPPEAIRTEFIVGQLQQEIAFGVASSAAEFNAALDASIAQSKHPHPRAATAFAPLTDAQLETIRGTHAALLARWRTIKPGEHLDLTF